MSVRADDSPGRDPSTPREVRVTDREDCRIVNSRIDVGGTTVVVDGGTETTAADWGTRGPATVDAGAADPQAITADVESQLRDLGYR